MINTNSLPVEDLLNRGKTILEGCFHPSGALTSPAINPIPSDLWYDGREHRDFRLFYTLYFRSDLGRMNSTSPDREEVYSQWAFTGDTVDLSEQSLEEKLDVSNLVPTRDECFCHGCGHGEGNQQTIIWLYKCLNLHTNATVWVGSTCVKKFPDLTVIDPTTGELSTDEILVKALTGKSKQVAKQVEVVKEVRILLSREEVYEIIAYYQNVLKLFSSSGGRKVLPKPDLSVFLMATFKSIEEGKSENPIYYLDKMYRLFGGFFGKQSCVDQTLRTHTIHDRSYNFETDSHIYTMCLGRIEEDQKIIQKLAQQWEVFDYLKQLGLSNSGAIKSTHLQAIEVYSDRLRYSKQELENLLGKINSFLERLADSKSEENQINARVSDFLRKQGWLDGLELLDLPDFFHRINSLEYFVNDKTSLHSSEVGSSTERRFLYCRYISACELLKSYQELIAKKINEKAELERKNKLTQKQNQETLIGQKLRQEIELNKKIKGIKYCCYFLLKLINSKEDEKPLILHYIPVEIFNSLESISVVVGVGAQSQLNRVFIEKSEQVPGQLIFPNEIPEIAENFPLTIELNGNLPSLDKVNDPLPHTNILDKLETIPPECINLSSYIPNLIACTPRTSWFAVQGEGEAPRYLSPRAFHNLVAPTN